MQGWMFYLSSYQYPFVVLHGEYLPTYLWRFQWVLNFALKDSDKNKDTLVFVCVLLRCVICGVVGDDITSFISCNYTPGEGIRHPRFPTCTDSVVSYWALLPKNYLCEWDKHWPVFSMPLLYAPLYLRFSWYFFIQGLCCIQGNA